MKREDIKSIIEGITDEQLSQIMDLNGKDVEKEKSKFISISTEFEQAKQTIESITGELNTLKASNADASDWKSKFEALQADIEKQTEAAAVLERFNRSVGDAKFLNEYTQKGIFEEFKTALADEKNKGRSDAEIYKEITENRDGIFESPNKIKIPGAKEIDMQEQDVNAIRAIMGIK